jgi:NAD+ kinase
LPLLGVNSAPETSVGFFCGAQKGSVHQAVASALDGTMERTTLQRMRVERNGTCLHSRVLNEVLYCHASPAATSKYILQVRTKDPSGGHWITTQEEQRSSGLWIGPAAGSTAAQKSAGGRVLPLTSTALQYVVREPYTTRGIALTLQQGVLADGESLTLLNKMKEAKLYIDGHHIVYDANIGDSLVFRLSDEPLTVLGLARERSFDGLTATRDWLAAEV